MRAMREMRVRRTTSKIHKMTEMFEMNAIKVPKETKETKETKESRDRGFTLVEVMAVMIIVAVMAAIAIPKLASSSDMARRNADIATGHEVKAALDRYQVENGVYPTLNEMAVSESGALSFANFIPKYISKLDASTTQQKAGTKMGFDKADITALSDQTPPTHLIMLYLTADGSGAEVRVYNQDLSNILWTSSQ